MWKEYLATCTTPRLQKSYAATLSLSERFPSGAYETSFRPRRITFGLPVNRREFGSNCAYSETSLKQRMVLPLASEFKNCNLRPSAQADWERDGADASVDVKLSVALLEPPTDVRRQQARSRKATMLELDGHLPAVRVTAQAQINS